MRTIGVVTGSRADYGLYRPLLRVLAEDPQVTLRLYVTGAHLSPRFGMTVREIESDGFRTTYRLEVPLDSDSSASVARAMGQGTSAFADLFAQERPDVLVVLGDRFEMHAAVVAALPFNIPVVHLYGGELTEGAIDDALRHSMTKLSHLHFTATEEYANRLHQMGEEPWRVTVCGSLAAENLRHMSLLTRDQLEARLEMPLRHDPLLVTFHSVTLEAREAGLQIEQLLHALGGVSRPLIFSAPNADTGGTVIRERIAAFVSGHPRRRLIDNLGTQVYFSLMAIAAAMVGNSSSGILEAPLFQLPVVNIGTRQAGRTRAGNVIDVGYGCDSIVEGLNRATDPVFRALLKNSSLTNVVPSQVIAERLKSVPLDDRLLRKRFQTWPLPTTI